MKRIVYEDYTHLLEYISASGLLTDVIRELGWLILKALAKLVDGVHTAIEKITSINLTELTSLIGIKSEISKILVPLMTVFIVAGGLSLIVFSDKVKIKDFTRNTLIVTLLICAFPFITSTANQFQQAFVSDITISKNGDKAGTKILKDMTYDLEKSLEKLKGIAKESDPYYIEINEVMERKEPFNYKITEVLEEDGERIAKGEEIKHSILYDAGVYRYSFDFLGTFALLVVMLVAECFIGIKLSKTFYDLSVASVLALPIFASDVIGMSRSKKFLQEFISLYITIGIVLISFSIFLSISTWVMSIAEFTWFVKVLLLIGFTSGVIDGADLIVKILGTDAGVKSGSAALMGMATAGRTVAGAGRAAVGVAKTGGKLAGRAWGIGKGIKGAAQSYSSGIRKQASGESNSIRELTNQQKSSQAYDKKSSDKTSNAISNFAERRGYKASEKAQKKAQKASAKVSNASADRNTPSNKSSVASSVRNSTSQDRSNASINTDSTKSNTPIRKEPKAPSASMKDYIKAYEKNNSKKAKKK